MSQKIAHLQEMKAEAAQNEDFDLAIALKEVCDRIIMQATDLATLSKRME